MYSSLVSTDNFLLRLVWGSYGNLRVPEWMIGVDEPDALVAVWESCAPAVPDPSWTKLEFLSTCLPLEEGASNRIVKLQGYPRWDVVLPHRRTCHEPLPQNGSGYRPDKPLTGGQEGKRVRGFIYYYYYLVLLFLCILFSVVSFGVVTYFEFICLICWFDIGSGCLLVLLLLFS